MTNKPKTTKKRSENAKLVAHKVSETVRKGGLVNLGKIIKESGYSEGTSKSPQRVTETISYKEEIEPIVSAMILQRDRMIKSIAGKNLDKASLRDLIDATDKLTKNIQLLSGKDTAKQNVVFGWEE